MHSDEVVAIEDVMSQPCADAHGNCVKAVPHQVPSEETSLFGVNPGEVLAAHLHPENVGSVLRHRWRGADRLSERAAARRCEPQFVPFSLSHRHVMHWAVEK
jgi:hypothetical protein